MKPQLERRSLRHRGGPPKKLVSAALPAPATTARCRVNSIWTFRGGAGGAWWESALTSVKWVEGPPICIFSSTWFLTAVSTFSRLILSLAETPVVIRSMSMVPVAPEISLVSPRDGKHGAGECSRLNLWRGRWPTAALLLPVIWMPPPHPVLPPAKKIFIYLWKTSGEAVWEDISPSGEDGGGGTASLRIMKGIFLKPYPFGEADPSQGFTEAYQAFNLPRRCCYHLWEFKKNARIIIWALSIFANKQAHASWRMHF